MNYFLDGTVQSDVQTEHNGSNSGKGDTPLYVEEGRINLLSKSISSVTQLFDTGVFEDEKVPSRSQFLLLSFVPSMNLKWYMGGLESRQLTLRH